MKVLMINEIFFEISLLIVFATAVSMIMRLLKQPLIIGHIFTGIIVGPSLLNFVHDPHTIEVLGKFGIALLLFIVGLGLNPRVIKELGKVAIITGIGQVVFTSTIGFFAVRALGYSMVTAEYLAVGLAFSSTIIVLKLLSDKKEQTQLHGKIAIGFLLVQDIIATFALVVASTVHDGDLTIGGLFLLLAKGAGAILGLWLFTRFIIKPLTAFLTRSQELLFLFALAWGFGIGALFLKLGFSLEVGALFAGVSLASRSFAQDIGSRLKPLRDFFIVVFFIYLGSSLRFSEVGSIWWQALLLSLLILVGNPLIVMTILGLLGYTKKTSFKTSLAVAQISEFSLIFVLLGHDIGDVGDKPLALITFVALLTFALSSYMIIYSDKIYAKMSRLLNLFERKNTHSEHDHKAHYDVIIFGYKKGGSEFARAFARLKKKALIVDYDPEVIEEVDRKGFDYVYGDATDPELLTELELGNAKSIISTITEQESTEFIVRSAMKENGGLIIICSADSATHAARLYEIGASYVMLPHTIGTEKISNFISKHGLKKSEFKTFRDKHLLYLANYIDELPEKHHKKLGHAVVEKIAELKALTKSN